MSIKQIIRSLSAKLAGVPGVIQHLKNLECHCNAKFDSQQRAIADLQAQLREYEKTLCVYRRRLERESGPTTAELLPASVNFTHPHFRALVQASLSVEVVGLAESRSVLDLPSDAGQRAHRLADSGLRSYLGVELEPVLTDFSRAHAPDKRFQFSNLESFDIPKESFGLVLICPKPLSYSLNEIERYLEIGLRALAPEGSLVFQAPCSLEDLLALGLDSRNLLERNGLSCSVEGDRIRASAQGGQNVASAG